MNGDPNSGLLPKLTYLSDNKSIPFLFNITCPLRMYCHFSDREGYMNSIVILFYVCYVVFYVVLYGIVLYELGYSYVSLLGKRMGG